MATYRAAGTNEKTYPTATQQGKESERKWSGSESDKLAGCTYIELAGIYKYDPSHTDGVKVEIYFYLGGNFTNDYNIARDYSYDITFRDCRSQQCRRACRDHRWNVAILMK